MTALFAYYSGLMRVDDAAVVTGLNPGITSTQLRHYCLDPTGRYLCILWFELNGGTFRYDAKVKVFDLQLASNVTLTIPAAANTYSNASYSPSYFTLTALSTGLVLLTGGYYSAQYYSELIDPALGSSAVSTVNGTGLTRVAPSADGNLLACTYGTQFEAGPGTWTPPRGVRLLEAATLNAASADAAFSALGAQGSGGSPADAALSPDGSLLAVVLYRALTVYNVATGGVVFTTTYGAGAVPRVQFSPAGDRLVVRVSTSAYVYGVSGTTVTLANTWSGFGALGAEKAYGRTFAFVGATEIADAYGTGRVVDVTTGALVRAFSPTASDFDPSSPYARHVATTHYVLAPPVVPPFWTNFARTTEVL